MILNQSNYIKAVQKLISSINNYKLYQVILSKLIIRLNKDGSFPQRPFNNLAFEGCKELIFKTRNYGYRHWLLKHDDSYYCVCIFKDGDDAHITYTWCEPDGTTHGGRDGDIYIPLSKLTSEFEGYIIGRIKFFEKRQHEDEQRVKDTAKVWEQLQKLKTYSLSEWEVKELI